METLHTDCSRNIDVDSFRFASPSAACDEESSLNKISAE